MCLEIICSIDSIEPPVAGNTAADCDISRADRRRQAGSGLRKTANTSKRPIDPVEASFRGEGAGGFGQRRLGRQRRSPVQRLPGRGVIDLQRQGQAAQRGPYPRQPAQPGNHRFGDVE